MKSLICRTNEKVASCKLDNIYATSQDQDFQRLGGFCAPIDESLK
jgi:hypothetical protein